jgi:hypothetical protein
MAKLKEWSRFAHAGVREQLQMIIAVVRAMDVEIGSSGDGEITLRWPDGERVYVKRYRRGKWRWRLATNNDARVLRLEDRDPTLAELQTAKS